MGVRLEFVALIWSDSCQEAVISMGPRRFGPLQCLMFQDGAIASGVCTSLPPACDSLGHNRSPVILTDEDYAIRPS